jgi:hypothetical protein
MKGDLQPIAAGGRTLASVRRDLERWRRDPERGRCIPPALWQAAAALAREHGVSRTARALRLEYYALEKRVASSPRPSPPASGRGAFVEVAWPTPAGVPAECRLELTDGRGARLCVELRGAARAELEGLARALWGAGR